MYIKEKTVRESNVLFKVSPVFETKELVERCRSIIDHYFTFVKFENYTQKYNFRKYSLSPIIEDYIVSSIVIGDLLYSEKPILIECFRNGDIEVGFPEGMSQDSKDLYVSRFERLISYAL